MMIMAKPLLRRCPVLLASWAVACSSLATPAARTLRQRCMYHQPLSCHGAAFAQLSMNTSEQGRGRRFRSALLKALSCMSVKSSLFDKLRCELEVAFPSLCTQVFQTLPSEFECDSKNFCHNHCGGVCVKIQQWLPRCALISHCSRTKAVVLQPALSGNQSHQYLCLNQHCRLCHLSTSVSCAPTLFLRCNDVDGDGSSSSRGGGGGGSSASTAAQKRSNVPPGTPVLVVQKQHQRSGELTRGTVARNLTNSGVHPRGQKVMLTSGVVGRVHTIEKTPGAAAFTTLATDAPDDSGSVETSLPLTIPEADGLDAQQSRGSRHQRQGRDQEAGTGRRWTYVAGALVEEEQAQSAPGTSARYVRGQRGNKRQ
eukprot:TRINITY_DN667_c0_g1_i3.p1 TRINITY_DN667_c0_g1~~TRINITY_DN667_c0_g1_i3.p1  ORF type:complete len:387 (+),score=16.48 TRINITY_DN667_c0_g1_i3:55-1161(+)